jgi:hypothetical protein
MRGLFGGKRSSCDSCNSCNTCDSCGSYGSHGGTVIPHGAHTMPKAAEQIPAPSTPPKKMPGGDKKTGLYPPRVVPAEPIAAPASPRPLDLGHSPY